MIAAAYLRKSNDEGEKSEDVKSVTRQLARCHEYAAAHGWSLDERYVYTDDGVSGAEFKKRPGLQALLAALEPVAPFQILLVSEQPRLGRDTVRTLGVIQELQDAGVKIFAYLDDREISLEGELAEVQTFIGSWASSSERRKTGQRIKDTLRKRAEDGYVAGGRVFGYRNERATPKAPVSGTIHEAEAATVRRIFEETAAGRGLQRIAKQLSAEGVPAPRSRWSATGVREILRRDLYRGRVVYGRIARGRKRSVGSMKGLIGAPMVRGARSGSSLALRTAPSLEGGGQAS